MLISLLRKVLLHTFRGCLETFFHPLSRSSSKSFLLDPPGPYSVRAPPPYSPFGPRNAPSPAVAMSALPSQHLNSFLCSRRGRVPVKRPFPLFPFFFSLARRVDSSCGPDVTEDISFLGKKLWPLGDCGADVAFATKFAVWFRALLRLPVPSFLLSENCIPLY